MNTYSSKDDYIDYLQKKHDYLQKKHDRLQLEHTMRVDTMVESVMLISSIFLFIITYFILNTFILQKKLDVKYLMVGIGSMVLLYFFRVVQ